MQNAVLDCIRSRRSTRSYTDEQISPGQLSCLLEAAIWAPSGSNSQSWLFTAVQNKDVLLKLNALVVQAFAVWPPDDDYPAKLAAKQRSQKEGYNFFYNAPTLIIATNKPNYQNAIADCALALGNIFLAAESIGLGSCYINQLFWLREDESIRAYLTELGIPKEHVICSAAAVGYIAKPSAVPARKDGTVKIIR